MNCILSKLFDSGSYPATCRYGILIIMEIVDFGGFKFYAILRILVLRDLGENVVALGFVF